MRVMFVDDDVQVLRGIERMLDSADVDWEVETATSGVEALSKLAEAAVDVLVSDMKMPDMDGADLLAQVSLLYPDTVRIILSGQADKEAVYRAISPMHQYLGKPCEAESLRATVARALSLRAMLHATESHKFLGRISSLPSVPDLYRQVVAEAESEHGTVSRVGDLIAQDPAMAAKILQLANSAIFGCRAPVTSPAQAAALIGMDTLKSLVLSLQVFQSFDDTSVPGFSIDKLMRHSMQVACNARHIALAEKLDDIAVCESFTAGLLHDVGQLILAANAPEEFADALRFAASEPVPLILAERSRFGIGHDEIGGYLLALWGLPQNIVEAVAFHHRPQHDAGSQLNTASVVFFANLLDNATATSQTEQESCQQLLEQLGLTGRFEVWLGAVNERKD